jgi:hypothetical protein
VARRRRVPPLQSRRRSTSLQHAVRNAATTRRSRTTRSW